MAEAALLQAKMVPVGQAESHFLAKLTGRVESSLSSGVATLWLQSNCKTVVVVSSDDEAHSLWQHLEAIVGHLRASSRLAIKVMQTDDDDDDDINSF